MRLIEKLVCAARRALGTDSGPEIEKVRVFQTPEGVWKFRTLDGVMTWGSFPTRADAVRVAECYNFIEVEPENEDEECL